MGDRIMPETKGSTVTPKQETKSAETEKAEATERTTTARRGAGVKVPAGAKAKAVQVEEAVPTKPAAVTTAAASKEAMTRGYEQFAEFGTENFRAVFAAGSVLAKGMETLSEEVTTYTSDSFEAGMEAAKALGECKTFAEALDRQSAFARISFDKFVAETTKLSEISAKLAKDAVEPINARVDAATENFVKTIVT